MLPEIIKQWDANKGNLREYFATTKQSEYDEYEKIVKALFKHVIHAPEYDLSKMTVVDNGDYQGTYLFIIPEDTYQPGATEYLITHTYYGSCSGCDTLQAIHQYDYELPNEKQVADYMTLALHLVQKMQRLSDN